MPPRCLFEAMKVPYPSDALWWQSSDPASEWPSHSSSPGPLVGWAIDGFPIHAPYDEHGVLVTSNSTTVCGGSHAIHGFVYYWTPDPPHVLSCLAGVVARDPPVSVGMWQPATACPRAGVVNRHLRKDPDETVVLHTPQCAFQPYTGPYFIFPANPKLEGRRWEVHALVFGMVNMFLFGWTAHQCYVVHMKTRDFTSPSFGGRVMLLIFFSSRAVVFLVDPYWVNERLPGMACGILYGVGLPALNMSLGYFIKFELDKIHFVTPSSTDVNTQSVYVKRARLFWKIIVGLCVCEFIVQLGADIARGLGSTHPVLIICQYFFVAYGLSLASALLMGDVYGLRSVAFVLEVTHACTTLAAIVIATSIDWSNQAMMFESLTLQHVLETLDAICMMIIFLTFVDRHRLYRDSLSSWHYKMHHMKVRKLQLPGKSLRFRRTWTSQLKREDRTTNEMAGRCSWMESESQLDKVQGDGGRPLARSTQCELQIEGEVGNGDGSSLAQSTQCESDDDVGNGSGT